ncbi:MAG: CHASE sensor domain-containing protein, partial [Planctomycetota bacterium]
MFQFKQLTIRHKLIATIMVVSIISLMIAAVAYFAWQWHSVRNDMIMDLKAQAQIIAENSNAALSFEDTKDAEEVLSALKPVESIISAVIIDKDGQIFAMFEKNGHEGESKKWETDKCFVRITEEFKNSKKGHHFFEKRSLGVCLPVVLDEEVIGCVGILSDLTPMYAMLKRHIMIIVAVIIAASLVAYFAIKQADDEVGDLIETFNGMLGQIQTRNVQLMDSKGNLEKRVKRRTVEL